MKNRMFEIVYLLLNKNKITARELAGHFEVSERTIYRDIESLSMAGIPVYMTKGKNGGISLVENFVFNKSLLSSLEQNEILYALQSLKAASGSNDTEILLKLSSIFNKKSADWIEIDFSRYGEDNRQFFESIKYGIINKNVIEFEYHNSLGEKSKRKAEPLKLWFKERSWYLFAYCLEKNDIRQFKITRMKSLKVLEERFERELSEFQIENKERTPEKIKLVMEISRTQAYRIYDEFYEEDIKIMENGNFEVTMEYYENEQLYGYLLSYGELLKIIEPDRIRKILLKKIKKMLENYSR